jgi:hypothetical protein
MTLPCAGCGGKGSVAETRLIRVGFVVARETVGHRICGACHGTGEATTQPFCDVCLTPSAGRCPTCAERLGKAVIPHVPGELGVEATQ